MNPPGARILALLLVLCACASTRDPDPKYEPTQSLLEAVSVLRLHVEDDTYRFPPARDFAGKNVYRATLARLESLEEIHAAKFRSGYMVDVILFAKARALERMTEFDLAAKHYLRVSELDSPLAPQAASAQRICARLAEAAGIEPAPDAPVKRALELFEIRRTTLVALREELLDTHYAYVIDEELERADRARAQYFAARSALVPGLAALALELHQELVSEHAPSKHHNRNLLELADFYATLSRRYVARFPPVSLDFDPGAFDEYAFGARRLYEVVSRQDGTVEKIEAARKLEAFLGFTLSVYDEKLPR